MSKSPAISDQHIITVLGAYAGMVDRVLRNPGRWLGTDEHPPPCAPFPARALDALQAALGAAAAGLAVCAAAREHGATAPEEWIPILGRVLFDRELHAGPD